MAWGAHLHDLIIQCKLILTTMSASQLVCHELIPGGKTMAVINENKWVNSTVHPYPSPEFTESLHSLAPTPPTPLTHCKRGMSYILALKNSASI